MLVRFDFLVCFVDGTNVGLKPAWCSMNTSLWESREADRNSTLCAEDLSNGAMSVSPAAISNFFIELAKWEDKTCFDQEEWASNPKDSPQGREHAAAAATEVRASDDGRRRREAED